MSTCGTCRFMAAPREVRDLTYTELGEDDPHQSCVRILHGNLRDDVNHEPALVLDGSGYAARLAVLPTFGCVLHEPKEST